MWLREDYNWAIIPLTYFSFSFLFLMQGFYQGLEPIFLGFISILGGFLYIIGLKSLTKTPDNKIGVISLGLVGGYLLIIPLFKLLDTVPEIFEFSIYSGETIADNLKYSLYQAFITAAFPEEMFKFIIFVLILHIFHNKADQLETMMLAASVSMGFAIVENFTYMTNVVEESFGISRIDVIVYYGEPEVIFIRLFTAYLGHLVLGILMGYFYYGYNNLRLTDQNKAYKMLLLSYFIPFLFHGTYNTIVFTLDNAGFDLYPIAFVAFIITGSIFVYCYKLIISLIPDKLIILQEIQQDQKEIEQKDKQKGKKEKLFNPQSR